MTSQRQFFLGMMLSSLLGGAIAIGGYLLIRGNDQPAGATSEKQDLHLTNYKLDTANFIVPSGMNFVYAAKTVTPAVVHIRTLMNANASRMGNSPLDSWFREYFGERQGPQNRQRGAGSGVIIDKEGYIVTNNHVIEDASEIEVLLNDNRTFKAKLVGADPSTDLAVIKIESSDLPYLTYGDSERMQVGEWVLAVGNPFEFRSTVTAGIVSAKARNIGILRSRNDLQIESFIQTDAAVNPGNSGGALVNLRGELVGINTAIATPTGTFAGYSFAVPTTLVQKVVKDLREFGVVQRALLGVRITDLNAEIAKQEDIPVVSGAYIASVNAKSAADDAGLESGDVIVAINGKEVNGVSQLQELIAINRPGDKVNVEYIRKGKRKNVNVVLKNTVGTTEIVAVESKMKLEGAVIEEVSVEQKNKLKLDGGVIISELGDGKFKQAGIKKGFIITSIDKQPINDVTDLTASLNQLRPGDGILIEGVYPNGEKSYYGVGW